MRLLVTGREGQLAQSLAEQARMRPDLELHFAARPECDLAVPGSTDVAIRRFRPDLIVNAAAYTAVDRAEAEPDLARRINAEAAGEIAEAAASLSVPLIQLSTDYVYDGGGDRPLSEDRDVSPLGVYGATKAEGERRVRAATDDHLILRTAWVYSPFGQNFVKTMLRLAAEREEIGVVADQIGSPTSALDLADVVLALAEKRLRGERQGWGETLHAAGNGQASWAEVAGRVMITSGASGGPSAHIRPIATTEYPTPARRPAWSVLDGTRLAARFGLELPQWEDSLNLVVRRLVGDLA